MLLPVTQSYVILLKGTPNLHSVTAQIPLCITGIDQVVFKPCLPVYNLLPCNDSEKANPALCR